MKYSVSVFAAAVLRTGWERHCLMHQRGSSWAMLNGWSVGKDKKVGGTLV